ncbi:MAG: glutamate--tRNA ligase [Lachnospiraceae bacterium]|nr:glutamate--tRNA ligase [Lachnospiraceae bacterium]
MKIRTRFAPSPTGKMHVGNLRSALYEYLIAKHSGGDFIIRIEDTDQERFLEGATEIIFNTLKQAGLEYDEGPGREGKFGPYVQSERKALGIYRKYAEELIKKGEAYYCFCAKTEKRGTDPLENAKDSPIEANVYDKKCLSLTKEAIEKNLAAGIPYVIRQNNPRTGTTTFHDELYGDITVENTELDDMILLKSDGFPTYNFANVVDDHLMEITHVVRGNEYLSSSPKYNRLYEAFGWQVPIYVHLPLITDTEHKKLSKRSGHSSFEDLLGQGFIPEAIVNFIALLGWSPESNQEIFSLTDLVNTFDYKRISKAPSVFDIGKLRWLNGEYIKMMELEKFYQLALPHLKQAIRKPLDLRKIAEMVKTRIELWSDIPALVDFFEELPEYDIAMYTHKKMKTNRDSALAVLEAILPVLAAIDDYSNDTLYEAVIDFVNQNEFKNGYVMWPIRTAVSGKQMTPAGATEIMEILGKEESLKRIRKGIEILA